jgi:predicted enzyme involved in methoxymalonyl-ACP biosynthesis
MYAETGGGNEARKNIFGWRRGKFIKSLDNKVILEASNDFTIPRIAQLTHKTNQYQ